MKTVIYQVKIGKSKLYDHCVQSVADYCKRHNIEHVVQRSMILNIKPDPFASNRNKAAWEKHNGLVIFEKENAFPFLKTHDQVAVVDSDIYIRPDAPNIFEQIDPNVDFAGHVERDGPITEQHAKKLQTYSRMQYGNLKAIDWKWNNLGAEFFNMGLMVMNKSFDNYLNGQTPRQFLSRPEFKAFIDGKGPWKWSTDQTLLNTFVKESKMKTQHLSYKWNALYGALVPMSTDITTNYYQDAHFIHFFLKDKLPQRGENVQQLIREISR